MREKPILFSGPMVRAILEGRKTQTRRVLKPQPARVEYWKHGEPSNARDGVPTMRDEEGHGWAACGPFRCPFIAEGMCASLGGRLCNSNTTDLTKRCSWLWVRETWHEFPSGLVIYKADQCPETEHPKVKWKPSIFLPRSASRITLEIESVRVERVQEISANDCFEEGIQRPKVPNFGSDVTIRDNARNGFGKLWDSINAKRGFGWETNPWVWVVTFRLANGEGRVG